MIAAGGHQDTGHYRVEQAADQHHEHGLSVSQVGVRWQKASTDGRGSNEVQGGPAHRNATGSQVIIRNP
jgi:hypothetical protein